MLITEANGPLKLKENAERGFQMCLEDATVAQSFVHWRQQKGISSQYIDGLFIYIIKVILM